MHREIEGVLGQWIVAQVAKALLAIVVALFRSRRTIDVTALTSMAR